MKTEVIIKKELYILEIKKELDFIGRKMESFCNSFVRSNDLWDVYQISFSDENVYFSYVTHDGRHFSNSISLDRYVKWKDDLITITKA